MEKYRRVFEESPLWAGLALALLGGVVSAMRSIKIEEMSPGAIGKALWHFFVQVVSAGLVGMIVTMLMMSTSWSPFLEGALIAVCGSCATMLLNRFPEILYEWIRKVLGLKGGGGEM